MKILTVMNYRPGGGLTGAVEELLKSLRGEGFVVDVASTYGTVRQRIRSIFDIFGLVPKYDFVMCAGCAYYGFLPILVGVLAGRMRKKRVLADFHEGFPVPFMKRFGRFIRLFLKDTPVTVASGHLFDIFKKYNFNVHLIPYHFHYEDFFKTEKTFNWNKKFLWVGSFQFMYDPETALKASRLILKERDDVEFHFFGEGPLLKKMMRKYNHSNIKFWGFVPRGELLRRYQDFSVLINTSFGDNFPLRVVEASFNKLLVISVRGGGTPTIYNENECLFFERKDYKGLSRHIAGVLKNPHLYDSFRENIHGKVMNFTWDKVKDKWLNLILP